MGLPCEKGVDRCRGPSQRAAEQMTISAAQRLLGACGGQRRQQRAAGRRATS